MQNFVAILAAGKGSRMGLSQPKQFEMLNGKTILEHSIDTFEKHPLINGIFVVVHKDFVDSTRRLLHVRNRPKIIEIIAGGEERMNSSYNAILALENHVGANPRVRPTIGTDVGMHVETHNCASLPMDCNLLIHDAARPFVSEDIITRTINALSKHSAVSVAIPATDTVYLCDDKREIQSSPKRDCVYYAQTPQAARLSVFKQAFASMNVGAGHAPPVATDDANVILNYLPNEKIHIVLGDPSNRKITFQTDLIS